MTISASVTTDPGVYELVLESFDTNSSHQATLKTVTISITVIELKLQRDEPVPSEVEIVQGDFPTSFWIQNLYASPTMNSEFNVNLRQTEGTELTFVRLEEHDGETLVQI